MGESGKGLIFPQVDGFYDQVSYEHGLRNTSLLGYFIDECVEWFLYDYVYSRVLCGHDNLRMLLKCITYGTPKSTRTDAAPMPRIAYRAA